MDDLAVELDPARQRQARAYALNRRILGLVDLGVGVAFLIGLVLTGENVALRRTLTDVSSSGPIVIALFSMTLFVAFAVISLPTSVIGGWWLPRRNGLSVQSWSQWFVDWLKGFGLSVVLGVLIVEGLYFLLGWEPRYWWLVAAGLYLLLVVVMANLAPVVILPLFYRLVPIPASPLTERLQALAEQARTHVRGVYRMDLSAKTTAANAALMGIGNTRRIVIGDTLLDRYTDDEIEVIFAHELGHHVHHDIPVLVAIQAFLTMVGLFLCSLALPKLTSITGLAGIADVAGLPMVILILGVVGSVTAPVVNTLSRRMERAADEYALRTTNNAEAFVAAMTRLANQNLAEYDAARWIEILFFDHPSIGRRIRLAQSFGAGPGR